jgi:4-amino-4-deoxychorismate lyase
MIPIDVLINGEPVSAVSVQDRGLHYGDGLFETIAVRAGGALGWERHVARLQEGCRRLGMAFPPVGLLTQEAGGLCRGIESGVLKVMLTRGTGGRGYRPPRDGIGTRILAIYPWPDYPAHCYREGVRVWVCRTRLGINPTLAGLKHLNRLEQVLARSEWQDPDIAEGLMLDHEGYVIEGTQSNLFMVRDGILLTPDLSRAGVAGITRARIMEWAKAEGRTCAVAHLTLEEVMRADEVLLCNSLIGVWPVREIERVRFPVGGLTRDIAAFLDQDDRHIRREHA